MPTTATAGSGTTYPPAPAGNHLAICIGVVDMGTREKVFDGKVSWKPTVRLIWELCDEQREDGQQFTLSREFSLTLHENSALRPFLEGWRGRPFTDEELKRFDVKALLGVPCMLSTVHMPGANGKTYVNVLGAAVVPKRVTAPEPVNELLYYSTDDGPPPETLPKWLRERILECKEFRDKKDPADLENIPSSDGPPETGDADDLSDVPF